jgi:hypothetical protein
MPSLFLVTLFALFTAPTALAGSSCIAFDAGFELLAFGFGGKDYNVGTSDQWASGRPLRASERPLSLILAHRQAHRHYCFWTTVSRYSHQSLSWR